MQQIRQRQVTLPCLHDLCLELVPEPHSTLHSLQPLHSDQLVDTLAVQVRLHDLKIVNGKFYLCSEESPDVHVLLYTYKMKTLFGV